MRQSNKVSSMKCTVSKSKCGFNIHIHTVWRKNFGDYNRPFYRYGGHIELIRFKEYYRMPRGHDHISFVFSSVFRDIFS